MDYNLGHSFEDNQKVSQEILDTLLNISEELNSYIYLDFVEDKCLKTDIDISENERIFAYKKISDGGIRLKISPPKDESPF